MSAGRPPRRSPAPMGSPPTTFRTLPSLSEGQTPVFTKCPAHAGTGATMATIDEIRQQLSGPRGHRGNMMTAGYQPLPRSSGPRGHRGNVITAHNGATRTVRPTRAQGQQHDCPAAGVGLSGQQRNRCNPADLTSCNPCDSLRMGRGKVYLKGVKSQPVNLFKKQVSTPLLRSEILHA